LAQAAAGGAWCRERGARHGVVAMAEYQTVKITSMVLDQNTGKLLGYKDDAGNFYPAPEEDGKQPSPEQAVSAMQAQQQAQVPAATAAQPRYDADMTRMNIPQAQPAQAVPAVPAAPVYAQQAPPPAAPAAPAAPQRRSLKFPEAKPAKPAVTQYTGQPMYSTPAPQAALPPQYAPAPPPQYVEPQPTNFSYVPPVVQPPMMPHPQLQQGSYVPPPLPGAIQAQAMQPYQAPLAQAQYMQPPLQQGSYVPPPMDMGMMPPHMAMAAPAMPVQAVPAQMGHPMDAMQAMPMAMPQGFHAPPMGLPPHEAIGLPPHEAMGLQPPHEPNPFLHQGGMHPGAALPGMGMPPGMGGMGMPHQVMGAHPGMGAPPMDPRMAGFAGFGGLGGQAMPQGMPMQGMPMQGMPMQGMPMQPGMPIAGAVGGYGGGYGGALPPTGA